jgi:hypothetical protein
MRAMYVHIMAYIQHHKGREMYNVRHAKQRIVLTCNNVTIILGIYVCLAVLGLLQLNFKRQKGV